MELDTIATLAVMVFTSIALCIDLKCRRIPNWLTVSSAVLGLAYHVASSGVSGLFLSLGGFGTGFGILLILWLIGGGGGGDVKLMGAIGAWLGAFPTLLVFIGSAVFAVVCTIGLLVWAQFAPKRVPAAAGQNENGHTSVMKQTIPYALPVTLSIWTLLFVHFLQF